VPLDRKDIKTMKDEITREKLINTIFENVDDKTDKLEPSELNTQKGSFRDKWINSVFPDKSQYKERDEADSELWKLIQSYKKTAFAVGFDAAMVLMQKG
jgi:hypothetical protein